MEPVPSSTWHGEKQQIKQADKSSKNRRKYIRNTGNVCTGMYDECHHAGEHIYLQAPSHLLTLWCPPSFYFSLAQNHENGIHAGWLATLASEFFWGGFSFGFSFFSFFFHPLP